MGLWRCPGSVTRTCMPFATQRMQSGTSLSCPFTRPQDTHCSSEGMRGFAELVNECLSRASLFSLSKKMANNRDPRVARSLQHQCPAPAQPQCSALPLAAGAAQWLGPERRSPRAWRSALSDTSLFISSLIIPPRLVHFCKSRFTWWDYK